MSASNKPARELQPVLTLTPGQKVHVTGQQAGSCWAEVMQVTTPDELPAIPGAPDVGQVRGILKEHGLRQMALIAWEHPSLPAPKRLSCSVLGNGRGKWWDVNGQSLTIRAEVLHAG